MIQQRIKCPKCNVVLDVQNSQNHRELLVRCPKCSTRLRVKFDIDDEEPHTMILSTKQNEGSTGWIEFRGERYNLNVGHNVIGRASSSSSANVSIRTTDKTMSRNHALVEVIRLKRGRVKIVLSNSKKTQDNPTFLNDEKLDDLDKIVLEDGDCIRMGSTIINYFNH